MSLELEIISNSDMSFYSKLIMFLDSQMCCFIRCLYDRKLESVYKCNEFNQRKNE